MKKISTLLIFVISLSSNAQTCLSLEEQKRLGTLLEIYRSDITSCQTMRGTPTCLTPAEELNKEELEDKLIECSKIEDE